MKNSKQLAVYSTNMLSRLAIQPSSALSANASPTAMHDVRTSSRAVSCCCSGLGPPSMIVGIHSGRIGDCQATTIGSWLPAAGTTTWPTLLRKRESRVRASDIRPQVTRSPWLIITSPENTLKTSTACGVPGQPPGGACNRAWRSSCWISAASQPRCGLRCALACPSST